MNPRFKTLLSLLMILVFGPLSLAQVEVSREASDKDLWTDAMYYLKIGRMEYGQAYLQAYLDRKVDPVKTLEFSEQDPRSVQILIRMQTDPKIGPLARAALDQIDKGWQVRRQDIPRIQAEIERLTGTSRAQFQATERLREAGEYAVPVMLEYLADTNRPALHAKIIDALVALGPSALEPLVAAVNDLPVQPKLLVLRAIGRLDYSQSIPYLKQIIENPATDSAVRNAANRAMESILSRNPKYRTDCNAAGSFYLLAMRYYYHDSAIKPVVKGDNAQSGVAGDVTADQPNIWFFRGGKLVPQPVPWEIYYELMTMRLTRRSLELEGKGGYQAAMTLWLMANCKRESKLSAAVVDPIHAKDFPDSQYFFRCAGTRYGLEALARSMSDGDNVIVLSALEALREIASGNDILATACNTQPMVNALNHRNQTVQTYAALALGWATPCDKYPGMENVVPILGKILAGPKSPLAVVIVPNAQKRSEAAKLTQTFGYNVTAVENFDSGMKALTKNPADVELIIVDYDLATPSAEQAINRIRENNFLKLVPIIVTVGTDHLQDATTVLGRREGLAIVPEGTAPQTINERVGYLRKQLGRVILSNAEITKNAMLAVSALERLSRAKIQQYNVEAARESLVGAMLRNDWTLGIVAAKTLSQLPSAESQRSLADAALSREDATQKICLLNFLTDSVRSFCSKLTAAQVTQLQDLVIRETTPAIRQATAKTLGALNLEPQVARNVLLAKEVFGASK